MNIDLAGAIGYEHCVDCKLVVRAIQQGEEFDGDIVPCSACGGDLLWAARN